ncbi:hypothetical protein HYE59_02615 [Aggregatibacter actinomycetemcomitans]|uniref:hypothetical protein n=1 Tax=Aggregatibacter actinomycetemcomitans TaxID=714 RepID=UPI00197B7F47|nr:hypothetical protein [Aggregatibacter actinomycetemcomitans]MBN6076453.1 hypothetical protein [Aggregatibacter actinomycetemcomitans]
MLNSISLFDEIQQDISRLKTLNTCLEMACATSFIRDESELKGFVLDIAHFQNLHNQAIQAKLEQCITECGTQGGE